MTISLPDTTPTYDWQQVRSPKLDLFIASVGYTNHKTPEPCLDIGGTVFAIPSYMSWFFTPGNANTNTLRVTKEGLENGLIAMGIVETLAQAKKADPKISDEAMEKIAWDEIQESFQLKSSNFFRLYQCLNNAVNHNQPTIEQKQFFDACHVVLSGMDDTPTLCHAPRPAAKRK